MRFDSPAGIRSSFTGTFSSFVCRMGPASFMELALKSSALSFKSSPVAGTRKLWTSRELATSVALSTLKLA
jgi:hypothetical protein